MNTQSEIKWINQELLKSSDPSVIQQIKDFLVSLKSDEANSSISLEKYNEELEEGVQEIKNGDFISEEDLGKEIATW